MGDGLDDLAALQLIDEQMQGPACVSVWRFATGDGDEPCLAFAIKHRRTVAAALAAVVLGIMLAFQVLLWAALKPVGGLNEVFANLRR